MLKHVPYTPDAWVCLSEGEVSPYIHDAHLCRIPQGRAVTSKQMAMMSLNQASGHENTNASRY